MDEDLINRVKALKLTIEESIQSSRKLDIMARFFLTEEEIEEATNLRKKHQENIQRIIEICNYIVNGKSDKLEVEFPNIDMVLLEMEAGTAVVENIENQILDIYETAAKRSLVK